MSRLLRLLGPIAALPVLIQAAAPPPPGPAASASPRGAVRVSVETIAVDRRGTWSLGTDVADLFSGRSGVLEKSATLMSRGADPVVREMVQMTTHLTPTLTPDGGCSLRIETETKSVVSGASAGAKPPRPDRTRVTIALAPEQERLMTAYSSTVTQGRLSLRVRCEAPPASPGGPSEIDLRFVDFVLSVARAEGDKDPEPMKSDMLRAAVGREASDLISFNVTLDPDASGSKRYRREKLEVALTPTLMSGGRVQIAMGVKGELATISADDAPVIHPIEHEESVVLSSGEKSEIEIEVRSSGPEEGWARVHYRLAVVATF
jgi:hypothetical protein